MADAGANLAAGTAAVAKEKASSIKDAAKARIADTTGGKIAAAIQSLGSDKGLSKDAAADTSPDFAGDSLSQGQDTSPPMSNKERLSARASAMQAMMQNNPTNSEVSDFVNRPNGTDNPA